ncbi:MAG: alpha-glucan family phosphorylase [bacterium]
MEQKWHTVTVVPALPERLKPLERLARNLWFTWNQKAIELWRRLDRDLWEEAYHNPVRMLGMLSQERLQELSQNESFLVQMEDVVESLDHYLQRKAPYAFNLENHLDPSFRVAYLSAEYGLTECLPFYSGGLGVLSGDHLKSASNLNVPLVGVGILYQKGYFGQYLNVEGWQQEYYTVNDYQNMPLSVERDGEGKPVGFTLEMGDRNIQVEIWRVQVGRVPLYLLTSNVDSNGPEDREVSSLLYGGDREMRIRQEVLLGMGGVAALETLGIEPTVFHMNEGHSAFAGLARIRSIMRKEGLPFDAALEVVKSNAVFTTHTPVPAGNDYFDPGLVAKFFRRYAESVGISLSQLLGLGRKDPHNEQEPFCMTILAIRLSNYRNGVSKLHRAVSRDLWQGIWPGFSNQDVPITSVTNGVHVPSYLSKEMSDLYTRYMGPRWIEEADNQKVWERIERIPDTELWRTHERRRERLINFARRRLREQLVRRGALPSEIRDAEDVLDPEALTICCSRRFASYKRADLVLRDPDRLAKILNTPGRPVQLIFAGKAHPQDMEGKAIIKNIVHYARQDRFRYRIVFIEDYDINVARYMVQGADVWLNMPRRPLEACGTSGMKAVANGALHMSILDGWWVEGYAPSRGWAIGSGEQYLDPHYQDEVESRTIYELLEKEVVPLFYERARDGTPRKWIEMMKASMRQLCPAFNTHRMLEDYVEKFYINAADLCREMNRDLRKTAEAFAAWKKNLYQNWKDLAVRGVHLQNGSGNFQVGANIEVEARVSMGNLRPEDLRVDLYCGFLDAKGDLSKRQLEPMVHDGARREDGYVYRGMLPCRETGKLGFLIRILPRHPLLVHPADMGLVVWA